MTNAEERITRCEESAKNQKETSEELEKQIKEHSDKIEAVSLVSAGIQKDLTHISEAVKNLKENDLHHLGLAMERLEKKQEETCEKWDAKQEETKKSLHTLLGQNIAIIAVSMILIGAVIYLIVNG